MVTPLHNDTLLNICHFADRQTLATFRLVSKLFANSETLHERLFGLEHPNLNLTQIQVPSWQTLRIQRILAERNFFNGLFQKELIDFPPEAEDLITQELQGRPFVAYTINCSDCIEKAHPPAFFLYDVQKKKTLEFLIPLPFNPNMDTGFILEELHGDIYVAIRCNYDDQYIFFLVKVDDERLTEIQRYTAGQTFPSFKWIFCKETNAFRLAMATENQLRISTTPTACITKYFHSEVCIGGHFCWGNRSLLMLHFPRIDPPEKAKISVYDLDTSETCFTLDTPHFSLGRPAEVLVRGQELTIFQYYSNLAYFFKFSSSTKMSQILSSNSFLANTNSRLTYLNGKTRYMTVLDSSTTSCKSFCLSTHHSWEFGGFFVFPANSTLIPCESQGLPILLAEESAVNRIEYNTEDSEDSSEDRAEHRSKVYVLNFNFTPTPGQERTDAILKIDAFICRYWRQIRSAFGDVGLFAFYLWKTRKKLP